MDYSTHGIKKLIANVATSKFENNLGGVYEDRVETKYLNNDVEWYGASKMIYVAVLDTIHQMYGGLMDYGYIRLIFQWLKKHGDIKNINEEIILKAEKDILPSENYEQLLEKISMLVNTKETRALAKRSK